MDRVFFFTALLTVCALALRFVSNDSYRVLLAKIITLYFAASLTLYQTHTVVPFLNSLFPVLILFNIVACAIAVGLGAPKGMRVEPYLVFFGAFLFYYVASSLFGNFPLALFAHKTICVLYIIAGICIGRMLLYYGLEGWLLRTTPYWAVPTLLVLAFVVAPQVTNYTDTSVEGFQQLGDVDLLNPNTFGLLVVPIFISLVVYAVLKKGLALRILCAVMAVLAFVLLVRIGSRTSFLAAVVPSGYAIAHVMRSRGLRVIFFLALGALLAYLFLFTNLSESYRVFAVVQDGEVSLSSRDLIWEDNLSAMTTSDHIIGTGGKFEVGPTGDGGGIDGLHSALMESYYTTGWVGSLLAIAGLAAFFILGWGLQQRGVLPVCFVLMGLLTGVGECVLLRGRWLVTVFFGVGLGLLSSRELLNRRRFNVPVPMRPGRAPRGAPWGAR